MSIIPRLEKHMRLEEELQNSNIPEVKELNELLRDETTNTLSIEDEEPKMSEAIDELIVEEEVTETPKPEKRKRATRTKKTMTEKEKAEEMENDDETTRKRDILASAALLEDGGLEKYVGEKVTAAEVRNMTKKRLESLFSLYVEKLGHEMAEDGLDVAADLVVRGVSLFFEIDDSERLKKDLLANKPLRRFVGRQVCCLAEKYGDFFSIAKCGYDIAKHVVVTEKPDLSESPESETNVGSRKHTTAARDTNGDNHQGGG